MGIDGAIDSSGDYIGIIVASCRNNTVGAAVNQLTGMQIVGRPIFAVDITAMTMPFSMLFIFPVFDVSTGLCGAFYIFVANVGKAARRQVKVITGCDKAVLSTVFASIAISAPERM